MPLTCTANVATACENWLGIWRAVGCWFGKLYTQYFQHKAIRQTFDLVSKLIATRAVDLTRSCPFIFISSSNLKLFPLCHYFTASLLILNILRLLSTGISKLDATKMGDNPQIPPISQSNFNFSSSLLQVRGHISKA